MASELEDKAQGEHRLGQLILENKSGAALSAGVPHLRAAAELWLQAGWPTRRAEVLSDLGRLHTKAGNHSDAAISYGDALRVFESADDAKRAIDAALGAGIAQLSAGMVPEALKLLKRAVELAGQLNDHLRIAASLLDLARAQVAEARVLRPAAALEAIATCERARKIFDAFKRRMQVAESQELQAQAQALAGDFAAAAACYELSSGIHFELGRSFEANEVLGNWAAMERDRGNCDGAIAIHKRSIELHTQAGNKALLAQSYRRLGMVYAKAGDHGQAGDSYQRSLDLCRMVDDGPGASRSLYLLGTTALRAGREAEGLKRLEECVTEAKLRNDIAHLEEALAAIVSHHRSRGDHQKALEIMGNWVDAMRERGERQEQLKVLGDIAEVHQEAGAFDEAEAHLRKLVEVCSKSEDQAERSRAHHGLGTLMSRRGAHREAYGHLKESLVGFGDTALPLKRAQILYQMANACLNVQDAELALQHLERAMPLCQQIGDDKLRAKLLVAIGNAKAMLGHSGEARTIFDEAADLCEKQGDARATTIIRRATQTLA